MYFPDKSDRMSKNIVKVLGVKNPWFKVRFKDLVLFYPIVYLKPLHYFLKRSHVFLKKLKTFDESISRTLLHLKVVLWNVKKI